ncbi:hypothetical protein U3516DRAFT_745508 [Neocallimastix sp. 'constans']
MIFKNSNLIIFQSPFQVKLFRENNDDILVDGTFFIAPKFTNEISVLIERYKNIEAKLIDTKCDRNNIINLNEECPNEIIRIPSFKNLIYKAY